MRLVPGIRIDLSKIVAQVSPDQNRCANPPSVELPRRGLFALAVLATNSHLLSHLAQEIAVRNLSERHFAGVAALAAGAVFEIQTHVVFREAARIICADHRQEKSGGAERYFRRELYFVFRSKQA